MPRMRARRAVPFVLMGCFFGCALSESYVPSGPRLAPKPENCDLRRVMPGASISEPFEMIGTLSLTDSWFSVACGYGRMMKTNTDRACAAGAEAIQFVSIDPPSWASTCYRSKANFVRFKN
jgi:hypothetical protein